jgi:SAM-dependent methyltransferase
MGVRDWIRNRLLDLAMRQMDGLRPEALERASGQVLEVGFGTALNLEHYPGTVTALTGLDPKPADGLPAFAARIEAARFPVARCILPADGELPFGEGAFDSVVTTWTLCSIPDPSAALAEMRRVLKPGGTYCFIEHGRAPTDRTARWQDRCDPVWKRISDGCHMNRAIDTLVQAADFEIMSLDRFRMPGPGLLSHMYRGVAKRSSGVDPNPVP